MGRRWRVLALVALAAILVFGVVSAVVFRGWMREGAELARAHARHEAAPHKGWSFPARVYSRPVPLDVSPDRLVAEAKARGYAEDCGPERKPGTYCASRRAVVPRQGAELEPVLLGLLIGPDAELREHLPLSEAPAHLIHAIVAAEDRQFFRHSGVDFRAMIRAAFANMQEGAFAQGGSTLSMQVVRSLTERREKDLWRKLREVALAMGLDRELGKQGVLQMYLDVPYLGQRGGLSVSGFAAASRHYFAKDVRDIGPAEAASLVAILPSPASLGPKVGTEQLRPVVRRILHGMAEEFGDPVEGALADEVKRAEAAPLPERHPAYLSAVRSWLEANVRPEVLYGGGLSVETGIDLPLQEETERLFAEKLRRFDSQLGRRSDQKLQAAGLAIDPRTGLVRALYGGTDASATGFNRAMQSRRQAGSSFKPLVFALAFSQRGPDGKPLYTAASLEPNDRRSFAGPDGPWRPRNVSGQYSPSASLAYALIWSQNVATAALLEGLGGADPLIEFAAHLGFDTAGFAREPGLALGQAETTVPEMTEFAALLANGGWQVETTPVWRAVDRAGNEIVGPPAPGLQVLDPTAAALTRTLLQLAVQQGTGTTVRGMGGERGYTGAAFGKTGTTDSEKDLWFVGATPALAMTVWLGYDLPEPIGANASQAAAPLWGWWMAKAMRTRDAGLKFRDDPKLVRRSICAESGRLAGPACKAVGAPFLPGTQPTRGCTLEEHLLRDEQIEVPLDMIFPGLGMNSNSATNSR